MLTNGSGLYKVFSTESVLNLLHCLYCKKPYKDPRLLHCGHTYCLPCLIQMNRYSTIRCIKCNSLQTVTSHAVDTLPKNLFVADIQCIPTVEIDRGAAYKETLRSLEDLKIKLLDFSGKGAFFFKFFFTLIFNYKFYIYLRQVWSKWKQALQNMWSKKERSERTSIQDYWVHSASRRRVL